ncbi:MAG: hypothetical protein KatS3mg124_1968 [Porticoccaceae bacterium]|nr:MAG: hypothetical protein KatS3mg124_1968 [Porticoccaceae bacterium]
MHRRRPNPARPLHRPSVPAAPPPPGPPPAPPPAERVLPAVSALLAEGWKRQRAGDLAGAIALGERALRIDPRAPEVYLLLATAHRAAGREGQALELARRGLAWAPRGSRVRLRLEALRDELTRP